MLLVLLVVGFGILVACAQDSPSEQPVHQVESGWNRVLMDVFGTVDVPGEAVDSESLGLGRSMCPRCECLHNHAFENVFSVNNGIASCCPPESIPNSSPSGNDTLCICVNPLQTFNSDSSTCECGLDTFSHYTTTSNGDVIAECRSCPSDAYAPSGTVGACYCNAGLVSNTLDDGSTVCLICPPESTYDYDWNTCQCPSSKNSSWYDAKTNTCNSCPEGLLGNTLSFKSCLCPGPEQTFDVSTGTCVCLSADSLLCSCQGTSTSVIGLSSTTCTCSQPGEIYQPGVGCSLCPPGAIYKSIHNRPSCSCSDPSAFFISSSFNCTCFGPTYFDPAGTGTCSPCGLGTDPYSDQGCICFDSTLVLDSSMNCVTSSVGPSGKTKRKVKREQRVQQLRLEESRNTEDRREMSNEVLCPRGEEACPILPSPTSYECIDTSSDPENCGGCASLNKGKDCLLVAGVRSATCLGGVCEASSCTRGWTLTHTGDGSTCV